MCEKTPSTSCKLSVFDLIESEHCGYLNSKLKEPDNVVGEGEEDDDDDEEPTLAHFCWLRITFHVFQSAHLTITLLRASTKVVYLSTATATVV